MRFIALIVLWGLASSTWGLSSPLALSPDERVDQAGVQLAGTPVMGERVLPVLRTNGLEYLMLVSPWEEAAQALKTGVPIIGQGTLLTVKASGRPIRYLFRPESLTVRGVTYPLNADVTKELLAPFEGPQ